MAAGQPQGMDRMQDQAFHAQVISQMDLLRRFNIADAMSGDKDSATDACCSRPRSADVVRVTPPIDLPCCPSTRVP